MILVLDPSEAGTAAYGWLAMRAAMRRLTRLVTRGICVAPLAWFSLGIAATTFTFGDASHALTVGISLFQGGFLVDFGQMAAASLTGIALVDLIALFAQRHLVRGVAHGGVN
ncbi:hypothetical protein [Oryzibacter oryziterrae]|uniref:hypothetical protein n=1 Tax=Oryzibacter oryziterrae TaxID=2766474 RepID=UPI001F3A403C|nr:hypothetical protein [Oryzibacter oryziterrae]